MLFSVFTLCHVCVFRCVCVCVCPYLTGAPLLWAGLSSTVTVLSVWFREVSWSYAGMEGAEKKTKGEEVLLHSKKNSPLLVSIIFYNESFSSTLEQMFSLPPVFIAPQFRSLHVAITEKWNICCCHTSIGAFCTWITSAPLIRLTVII